MNLDMGPDAVQRIKGAAQIAARHMRPNRGHVAVVDLLLTPRGITARFGCGGSLQEERGFVEMDWAQLKEVVG
jgi:hypothetical protein